MAKTIVTAAMTVVKIASCSSSDIISKQAKMTSRMPPMKVTQPLTPIRVEMPGSMPSKDTWKLAMPRLPVTWTHDPTDPYIRAIPQTRRRKTPRLNVRPVVVGLGHAPSAT